MARKRKTDGDGDYNPSRKKISTKKMSIPDQKTLTKRIQPIRDVTSGVKLGLGEGIKLEGDEPKLPPPPPDKPIENVAVSDENKTKAAHNHTTGLMKLPPELRNKIYEMVFPKSTVHVWSYETDTVLDLNGERKLERRTCWIKSINQGSNLPDLHAWDWNIDSLGGHQNCRHCPSYRGPKTIETSLLRVCREIYAESCLIPYQQSTFEFAKILDIEAFAKQAPSEQLNAIRDIVFVLEPFTVDVKFGPLLRDSFPQLRTLSIIAGTGTHWLSPLAEESFGEASEEKRRGWISTCLLAFQGLGRENNPPGVNKLEVFVEKNEGRAGIWAKAMSARLNRPLDPPEAETAPQTGLPVKLRNPTLCITEDNYEAGVRKEAEKVVMIID